MLEKQKDHEGAEDQEVYKIQIKKYKDALYFGQLNADGKRQGKGVMIYANDRKYEGEWSEDLRHGRGYERHSNGNLYIGQFQQGKAQGHGIYKWANGEEYDG
jgi:hypothetical protein